MQSSEISTALHSFAGSDVKKPSTTFQQKYTFLVTQLPGSPAVEMNHLLAVEVESVVGRNRLQA
jgi:hypothetical protein